MKENILITGAAGFIGFSLCKHLLEKNIPVIGFDNFNNYYDPSLNKARINFLKNISKKSGTSFEIINGNLHKSWELEEVFLRFRPTKVYNLAAQAGVRYSIENPKAYVDSNLVGFCNILEACRKYEVKNLIYASSSSVYGGNTNFPFHETQSVNHPICLYAAT